MEDRKQMIQALQDFFNDDPGNVINGKDAQRPELEGLVMYQEPLVGFAAADDPLFAAYRQPEVIGPWHRMPEEWLPGAKTVVSFFLPFTDRVRESNGIDPSEPSAEWLHGRVEGQAFMAKACAFLRDWLIQRGYRAVSPCIDPHFFAMEKGKSNEYFQKNILPNYTFDENSFGSNWSERHAAFACGLGTFGLSKNLITEKGCAGRLGSVITDAEYAPVKRPYTDLYEYCTNCGACIGRCCHDAISRDGKVHYPCASFLEATKVAFAPRYGCGKCQVKVPCATGIPKK